MLNGKLVLRFPNEEPVDVEVLCGKVVTLSRLQLNFHEREDLLAYLCAECWLLSEQYEPGRIARGFGAWATVTLKKRAIDWDQRVRRRRVKWQFATHTYERDPVELVSLDSGELDVAQREGIVDSTPDRSPDLAGILRKRNRVEVGDIDGPGKKVSRRAA